MKTTTLQNLDKQLIADSFRASGATYEDNATVQKEISRQLVQFLQGCDFIDSTRVLEIGCCTGILTELLVESLPVGTIYLNDIVQEFCIMTAARIAGRVTRVKPLPGDIETCVTAEGSGSGYFLGNLPVDVRSADPVQENSSCALSDEGYLVFSIFGPGTMGEISALTGRSLPYHSRKSSLQCCRIIFA